MSFTLPKNWDQEDTNAHCKQLDARADLLRYQVASSGRTLPTPPSLPGMQEDVIARIDAQMAHIALLEATLRGPVTQPATANNPQPTQTPAPSVATNHATKEKKMTDEKITETAQCQAAKAAKREQPKTAPRLEGESLTQACERIRRERKASK